MELDVCIKGRRSVRAYTDEPVSKEQIEAVLEAGIWAPTGMLREPWKFIVIEDKQLIKYVSDETKLLVQQMMPPQPNNSPQKPRNMLQCTRAHIGMHRKRRTMG